MINSIRDFEREWGYERDATLKLMRELTDASLAQSVARDHRTLGRLAWHVATSIREMMERLGFKLEGPGPEDAVPGSARDIADGYETASTSVLDAVKRDWTDATLATEDEMYGEFWARGFTLEVLLNHQIHHRGQMTVLMRQAGLRVHGVYGPAREDWATMGSPPPEV